MIQREELNFILQNTPLEELKSFYEVVENSFTVSILQPPTQQTLLQPIYDPISKGEFYGGEILVTSTIVSVGENKNKGWSMVCDFNEEYSLYIAVVDGCYGAGYFEQEIQEMVRKTKEKVAIEKAILHRKINASKVSFDLMTQG